MNDDNEMDEVEDTPDFNTVLEPEDEAQSAPRKGVGRAFVLIGFVAASLLGASLGIAGTKMLAGPDKTAALRVELEQNLEALQQASQTQTKQLGTANSMQKNTQSRLDNLQAENETLTDQIEVLEKQISVLQTTVVDENRDKDITDRIAVLEALSSEGEDVFTGARSITARLSALEKTVADAEQAHTQASAQSPIQSLQDKASALSSQTNTAEMVAEDIAGEEKISVYPPADTERQVTLDILIDTFPRAKMLAAVKAQETSSVSKPGWLKRTLSKHIKVSDDENIDPYATIDAAEAALKNGDITSALSHIAKLNPPIRSSAADWIQAAKKAQSQQ